MAIARRGLTGGASAASDEPEAMSESAARACQAAPPSWLRRLVDEKPQSSLCAPEVDVRSGGLIVRRHIGPVLGVMISIDDGEYRMVHVSVLCPAGDVEDVEFHLLAV